MSRPYQSEMTQIFDPLSELELSFISCILFEATPEETDVANTMLMLLQLHCRALEAMETSETSNGESNGLWLRLFLSQRPRDNEKTQVVFHLHRWLFDLFVPRRHGPIGFRCTSCRLSLVLRNLEVTSSTKRKLLMDKYL